MVSACQPRRSPGVACSRLAHTALSLWHLKSILLVHCGSNILMRAENIPVLDIVFQAEGAQPNNIDRCLVWNLNPGDRASRDKACADTMPLKRRKLSANVANTVG